MHDRNSVVSNPFWKARYLLFTWNCIKKRPFRKCLKNFKGVVWMINLKNHSKLSQHYLKIIYPSVQHGWCNCLMCIVSPIGCSLTACLNSKPQSAMFYTESRHDSCLKFQNPGNCRILWYKTIAYKIHWPLPPLKFKKTFALSWGMAVNKKAPVCASLCREDSHGQETSS